jgi:hypothetical protein
LRIPLLTILCLFQLLAGAQPAGLPWLRVSENRRFLVTEAGTPFFWLGDTGWELFHKLNRDEADMYLANRAAKGFNVIQAVLVSEMNGLTDPNTEGQVPFHDLDATRPNEAYFRYVDELIEKAGKQGLYIALLPTWGSWAVKEKHPLFPPRHFFTPENARQYGIFLGKRYKHFSNIIWVLGGDRNPQGYEATWEEMAKGLRIGDEDRHLMTYHPNGGWSSSVFWHQASWLDFNMIQTGHASRFANSFAYVEKDYERQPPKPVLDAETNYEDGAVSFHPSNGRFTDYDVRVSSYYSVFAGGFGISYGCNDIWQMHSGKNGVAYARNTWQSSLDLPGAFQMGHLRRLMESRPYLSRIPDQSVLLPDSNTLLPIENRPGLHLQATRDGVRGKKDATFIMVYLPAGRSFRMRTECLAASRLCGWWFNPRTGMARPAGTFDNTGTHQPVWNLLPWNEGEGPDWVYVVEVAAKNYPPPGSKLLQ